MTQFDRRGFIRAGSIFTFGFLSYGDALRLRADTPPLQTKTKVDPREVSVIHLLLGGGMSHQDTYRHNEAYAEFLAKVAQTTA